MILSIMSRLTFDKFSEMSKKFRIIFKYFGDEYYVPMPSTYWMPSK